MPEEGPPATTTDLRLFLQQQRQDLLRLWRDRVLSDARGAGAVDEILSPLIDRFVDALASGQPGAGTIPQGASLLWALRALSRLRGAIADLCARHAVTLNADQALLLHTTVDELMINVVQTVHDAARSGLDTSERQRQEALAREQAARRAAERSEAELRRLSDTGMLGIIVATGDGRILDANAAFLNLMRYDREDLLGGRVRWRDMTPPAYREMDDRALVELRTRGVCTPYEKVYLSSDGRPIDVLLGVASLDAAADTYVAYVLDIRARKAAELALHEANRERDATLAMLDTFMATAPVGFAVVDTQLRYVRINDTLAGMNGVSAADHIGRTIREVLPHLPPVAERLLHQVLETGQPAVGLPLELPGDGDPVHLLASYHPLRDPHGELLGVGGVVMDISAQKRAEQELRRDSDLRERFMAVLGHDLRSPIAAVLMSADALLRQPQLAPGHARVVQRVANSARRMDRLVADLLDLVRTRQSGGIPIQVRPMHLKEVCEQVVDEISAAHADRAIQIEIHGGCQGRFDPDRVAQLASNLITNAVLYSPPATPVLVETGGQDADTVFLRVHNQGAPIPADLIPELFNPFRRGQAAGRVSSQREGLGLGLYIAREIARAHGGDISVESSSDRGTTFTVLLAREPREP